MLETLRQKIDVKTFMVFYVGALLVWGAFYLGRPELLWKGLLVAALYMVFDLLWTYFRDKIWYLPSSSVISGFILAIVAAPAPPLDLLVLLPLIAVASKQLIKLGRPKHIFNPASFSMAVLSISGYQAVSWWGVAWGKPVLYAVLIAGLFILWRQKRFETAFSFLISYAVFLGILFWTQGREIAQLATLLKPQIFDGTALFFASVMLIEPMTSSFRGTQNRIIYGVLAGLAAVLFSAFGQYLFFLDPLIGGLLVGNLIMSLIVR